MKKLRWKPIAYYALSFAIPSVIILAALAGLKVAPFGDHSLAISDGNALYLNYLGYVGRALKGQEGIWYSFEKGLGGNMMGSWGWFLLNPFFALFSFADITHYMQVYTFVSLLNFSICGLTMSILLKDIYGHKTGNLIFSTAYALNGFLTANVFQVNFFTGVCALPLMVLGLRKITQNKNPLLYILSLAYSLLTNFYFGFMLCVASVLIFGAAFFFSGRVRIEDRKSVAVKYILSSLLAGLLSAVVWVPALLSLRGGRLDQPIADAISFGENMPFLDIFSKLFTGANTTGELVNGLPNIFVGILPVFLVILFFLNKKTARPRKAAAFLLVFYLVSFYIVIFNILMHGGTVTNWFNYRDSFIFSFLLLLIAAEEWQYIAETPRENIRKAALILTVATLIVFSKRFEYVSGGMVLADFAILAAVFLAYRMHRKDPEKNPKRILTLVVLVLMSLNLFLNYYSSTKNIMVWSNKESEYQEVVVPVSALVEAVRRSDGSFYRMEIDEQRSGTCGNDPMLYGYNGVGHGGSDERNFVRTALSGLGVHRYDMRNYYGKGIPAATDTLLGLKYIISKEDLTEEKNYEKLIEMGDWMLYQNPYALPIAFAADSGVSDVAINIEDVFANLNAAWSAMTGIEDSIFLEENEILFSSHNITDSLEISRASAASIVDSRDAALGLSGAEVSAEASDSDMAAGGSATTGTLREKPENTNYIMFTWIASRDGAVYTYNRSGMTDTNGSALPALNYEGYYHKGETVTGYLPVTDSLVTAYLMEEVAGRFKAAYVDADVLSRMSQSVLDNPTAIEKVSDSYVRGIFTVGDDQLLLLTIPYDEGWTCYIDGEKAEMDKALGLFMTVNTTPGEHIFELRFIPTGFIPAGIISLIGLALLPVYIVLDRKANRRKGHAKRGQKGHWAKEQGALKSFSKRDLIFIAGMILTTSLVFLLGGSYGYSYIIILALIGMMGLWLLYHSGVLQGRLSWAISIALMIFALGIRTMVFSYETLDYTKAYALWLKAFRVGGGFHALKYSIGNYNIPYLYFLALFSQLDMNGLYLFKLLSTLFDVLLAWSVLLLCSRFTKSQSRLLAAFFVTLILPTVFLDGAVWGQCDSLYVAPLLLGIWCAMSDRPWKSMIFAAVAFGFKLQAVFILPIYAVFLMNGKLRWKHFLAFPATYLALVLPAVCMGRPFGETVMLYFNQTGSVGNLLNYNSSSVFAFLTVNTVDDTASKIGVIIAFVYMIALLAVAWINRRRINDRAILAFSILFAIGIPFLLPHMHERYFYGADILSLVLAFSAPAYSFVAVLVQIASLLGYHAYLRTYYFLPMRYGAFALIIAMGFTAMFLLQSMRQKGINDDIKQTLNPDSPVHLSRVRAEEGPDPHDMGFEKENERSYEKA